MSSTELQISLPQSHKPRPAPNPVFSRINSPMIYIVHFYTNMLWGGEYSTRGRQ